MAYQRDMNKISQALRQAMAHVEPDGRLNSEVSGIIKKNLAGIDKEISTSVDAAPDKYLGAFDALPIEAKQAIVKAIENDDRVRMAGRNVMTWQVSAVRSLIALGRRLRRRQMRRMAKMTDQLAVIIQSGPAHLLKGLHSLSLLLEAKFRTQPSIDAVLSSTGMQIRNLAICYAQGVSQISQYRGFYHDALKHNTYGVIVGIDFLVSDRGCWFVESNLNFGMSTVRSRLYERDPLVKNLVDFVAACDYRHLLIMYNSWSHMDKVMANQYEEETRRHNLKLTIVEDVFLPKSGLQQSFAIPPVQDDRTFVVRSKFYHTSLDYLFQHKGATIRALQNYQKYYNNSPDLLLPATSDIPVLGDIRPEEPFPNLVFKLPERDAGEGIIFFKVKSGDETLPIVQQSMRRKWQKNLWGHLYSFVEDLRGIFQPYICSRLIDGNKLYKVRSHMLISPTGNCFLSANRVISKYAIPDSLPYGIVEDPKPYLINLASSSRYEISPHSEEEKIIAASLAVASGLAWAATHGYQTGIENEALNRNP